MKQALKKIFVLALLLSPLAFRQAHAEPLALLVTAPDAAYSGTYVYQGTRDSTPNCEGGGGAVQTRAYYRLEGTNYYLYVDYMNHVCLFPDWFYWFICDGLIDSPALNEAVYVGWEASGTFNAQDCVRWYRNDNGGFLDITSQMSVIDLSTMTVQTIASTLVTSTTGEIGGRVTCDSGAAITARGLVFSSTNTAPIIGGAGVTQIPKGTGPGSFFEAFSSLTPGVTYYYQAYGTNAWHTQYGGVQSFTTRTVGPANKLVSGIASPAWANGVYAWIGDYSGQPAWKHIAQNYWFYYSYWSPSLPMNFSWFIDNELKNDHSHYDYTCMCPTYVPSCPASGWSDDGGGTVTIVDYPQVDVTSGVGFTPASPAAAAGNNPIGRFFLKADLAGASLTAAAISITGTYTGVTGLKLWSSTDAVFNSGSDTLLATQAGPSGAFSGFSSSIATSGMYYFVTADLDATAGGSIAATLGSQASLTISGGAIVYGFTNAALTDGVLAIDPVTAISISDAAVSENAGTAVFTISLSETYSSPITVHYATADGTATTADSDYTALSGTATITAGQLSTTVSVPIIDDSTYEADETFYVNLSNPSAGAFADSQAVGTITNDDSATVSIGAASVAEGGALVFPVTLTNPCDVAVSMSYSTADGTATTADNDYTAQINAMLTIPAGQTSATITVATTADTKVELNETLTVTLGGLSAGGRSVALGTGTAVGTITNDDSATVSIGAASVAEGGALVFPVTLTNPCDVAVSMTYSTADGTATTADNDYTAQINAMLTIPAGQTSATIIVVTTADTTTELDETLSVTLGGLSAGGRSVTLGTATATGTITNDDSPPAIAINDASVTEGDAGTQTMQFTVSMDRASASTVTVDYATADATATAGADYAAVAATILTFAPGQTSKTIAITIYSDVTDEEDETFFVNLSGPVNATIADGQAVGTIRDNDAPPTVSIADAAVAEGDAGTATLSFAVTLSAASGRTVTVDYATADNTAMVADGDYAAASGTLTFAAGETSKTIAVTVNGDTRDEPDETFYVNLANPGNVTIADGQGLGTIQNDEKPDISVQAEALSVTPASDGVIRVSGTVTLGNGGNGALKQDVAMRFTLRSGAGCGGTQLAQWTETAAGITMDPVTGTQVFAITDYDAAIDVCAADASCGLSVFVEADYSGLITESEETNNTACADTTAATPNLTVSGISQTPECSADASFTGITVTVANTGCAAAAGAVVRLTSDCGLTFTDQAVDLAAGASQDLSFALTDNLASCACSFTAAVDPDAAVAECSAADNTLTTGPELSIPDLVVDNETLAFSCADNGTLFVQGVVTLRNNGCGPALSADVPVRITLYDGGTCGGSQVAVLQQTFTSVALAAGGTQTFAVAYQGLASDFCATATRDDVAVLVEADDSQAVCEWAGDNNTWCSDTIVGNMQDTVRCRFTLAATEDSFGPEGGTGAVAVSASDTGCSWAATSNADWITVTSATAADNGTVEFTVAENGFDPRTGAITIAGRTFTVEQSGQTCRLTVIPARVVKFLYDRKRSPERINAQYLDPRAVIVLLKVAGYATPLQFFTFIGASDTVFTREDWPVWNTDAMQTLIKVRLRHRGMLALVFINPFMAEAGTYEVTIGDCTGTVELVEP